MAILFTYYRWQVKDVVAMVMVRQVMLVLGTLILLYVRVWLVSGGNVIIAVFDAAVNPASHSHSFITRSLTYLHLCGFNFWLLLCPSRLCFDWSMGSIPLVEGFNDVRNIATALFFTGYVSIGCYGEYSTMDN